VIIIILKLGQYNKQMLEELCCRLPELQYDLDIIAEKLNPKEWKPLTEKENQNIRKYLKKRALGDLESAVQSAVKQNDPTYIHEKSDSELIRRMMDWNEAPQGKTYLKWLFFRCFPDHSAWRRSGHDLDLPLIEARKKYSQIDNISWL
jgi:hypothetical protein